MTSKYPHAWAGFIAFAIAWSLCGVIGIGVAISNPGWVVWAVVTTLVASFVGLISYASSRWEWRWT